MIPVKKDQAANRAKLGSRSDRPPAFDREVHKDRNTVERCVHKLRQYRAVATRYDKRQAIYRGTVNVASIRIWCAPQPHDPIASLTSAVATPAPAKTRRSHTLPG